MNRIRGMMAAALALALAAPALRGSPMRRLLPALLVLGLSFGAQAASPDGSTLTAVAPLVTAAGTWTFGAPGQPGGTAILLNGALASGGSAAELFILNGGQIYAKNSAAYWFLYRGGAWIGVSDPTGGGGGGGALPPPTTSQGNYGTGCGGSTCLKFDDHWAAGALDLASWYAGNNVCNGGTGGAQNCGELPGGYPEAIHYPFTAWCFGTPNGCQDVIFVDWPYYGGVNTANLSSPALSKAADGSLALEVKYYGNAASVSKTGCVTQGSYLDCSVVNWLGAAIKSGGLNDTTGYPLSINNPLATIPATGGMLQWRMKLDQGLLHGAYPGVECDAADGANSVAGGTTNANMEFGYTYGTGALHAVGLGINNTANETSSLVNTGDDGVGTGDLTNWHTFGLEWTGNAAHQWNYYIDGVSQAVSTHNETRTPSVGWSCVFAQGIANNAANGSFHTLWSSSTPGPFYMWISDVQFYKKPGT
jgi:hypothetical protein